MERHGDRKRPSVAGGRRADHPDGREYLRLGLTAVVLVAASCVLFVARWWIAAAVMCILTVVFVVGCLAVGALFARFAVGRKPSRSSASSETASTRRENEGKLGARITGAMSDLGELLFAANDPSAERAVRKELERRGIDPESEEERAADRAVGPLLSCIPPADNAFSGPNMPEMWRARLLDERLGERGLTLAWLETVPAWKLVRIDAEDGVELVGHVMDSNPGSGLWAVLVHGYHGTWREMIQYARRWSSAGYNLLVVEQRAHGRSGGRLSGMGWLERRDVVSWCRWLEGGGAGVPCTEAVLHGHSMGAATVAIASAECDLPACVCAAVVDCAFTSAWAAFERSMASVDVPCRPAIDLMRLYLLLCKGGYDVARADAVKALSKPGVPVLVVHGEEDPLVPVEMARELYGAADREKRLLLVPGAGHCQAVLADGDGYFDAVLDFVGSREG